MSNADCVSNLYFTFISKTCCNNVFSYITSSICRRAVYLRWIFTRESTAAMTSHTTISIYDNFTASQTSITMRATDYETASWVDEVFCIFINKFSRQRCIDNKAFQICFNLFLSYFRTMLRRNNDCINTFWFTINILNSNLSFTIWTKVC